MIVSEFFLCPGVFWCFLLSRNDQQIVIEFFEAVDLRICQGDKILLAHARNKNVPQIIS